MQVTYHLPARFNELLEVSARVTKYGRASIDFEQQVRRDGEILCEGVIRLASLDAASFRPRPASQQLIDRMNEERP